MQVIRSLILFLVASVLEIGGCYLIWAWVKTEKPMWYALAGSFSLLLYGIVAAYQIGHFGRVYAAYGSIFIVMSLLWSWKGDGFVPDKYDIAGAVISVLGACIIFYMPRK